jgi:deoxyribodipyrimidine photo-lyase
MDRLEHRLTRLYRERPTLGNRVLYWMQASVRVRDNLALAWAQAEARNRNLPLEVLFCLDPGYPGANARSFAFLLDGLGEVGEALENRGIGFTVAQGPALPTLAAAGPGTTIAVFDRGYLPFARRLRFQAADILPCPVVEVEDNASVPVALVSGKQEWSAATLRPKLMRLAGQEGPLPQVRDGETRRGGHLAEDLARAGIPVLPGRPSRAWLARLPVDTSVGPTSLKGGETAALARWQRFLDEKLDRYDTDRSDPNLDGSSGLSPYLHFGHLSPVTLVADLQARGLWREPVTFRASGEDPASKFVDEALVRRELSLNLVWNNPEAASYSGLPAWARRTLEEHAADRRPWVYTRANWEAARTHDPAWNAAQRQLVATGTIPNYLRMYWGKKILEWSPDPARAFSEALYLNDKYALDGRDPNSIAGVAWCFGMHDRPWGDRPIFGTVRSMTYGGLKRKFDIAAYERRWATDPGEFTLQS